jgi:hypothetical protein
MMFGVEHFLKSVVRMGAPKATMAGRDAMHYFLGPKSFEPSIYADREAYFSDVAKIDANVCCLEYDSTRAGDFSLSAASRSRGTTRVASSSSS